MNPRKGTQFRYCEAHEPYFRGETRYRQAEVFVEGGWASAPKCSGGECELRPGTDFYCESFVVEHPVAAPAELGWKA